MQCRRSYRKYSYKSQFLLSTTAQASITLQLSMSIPIASKSVRTNLLVRKVPLVATKCRKCQKVVYECGGHTKIRQKLPINRSQYCKRRVTRALTCSLINLQINYCTRTPKLYSVLVCQQQLETIPLLPKSSIQQPQLAELSCLVVDLLYKVYSNCIHDLLWFCSLSDQ